MTQKAVRTGDLLQQSALPSQKGRNMLVSGWCHVGLTAAQGSEGQGCSVFLELPGEPLVRPAWIYLQAGSVLVRCRCLACAGHAPTLIGKLPFHLDLELLGRK